jgi:hypothetical protein
MCVRVLPVITDNIIAHNGASGIQGWDVRSTVGGIDHNTIACNAHHGIALGGASSVVIENNIIAGNGRLSVLIRPEADKVFVSRNNLYANGQGQPELLRDNFSFDPGFTDPLVSMNFSIDPSRCCKEKDARGDNLGARQTP